MKFPYLSASRQCSLRNLNHLLGLTGECPNVTLLQTEDLFSAKFDQIRPKSESQHGGRYDLT